MRNWFLFMFLFVPLVLAAQYVESTAIREVDSLIQVSRALSGNQDFDKALKINAAAEKITLEKFGRVSAAYGNCCFNHGRVLYQKGDYPGAEKWYLDSKTIRSRATGVGKDHPDYAWSLNNLAILYSDMGNYQKAEPLYQEALVIREKVLGKDHPDYAKSLNNLANLYRKMGNYEKAEQLYLNALVIREKVQGKDHPDYAASLNNLAILYYEMGNYEKAEPFYLEALAIRSRAPGIGKDHPDYAASLNNLAILYSDMGNYEKAEPYYLEALVIQEKLLGKDQPGYAASLNNLGILYWEMGNYEKAVSHLLEAKSIQEKVLGKEHPDYASSVNDLAILYDELGRYTEAEPLYLEATSILKKILGNDHPDYAASLTNLAALYDKMIKYEKAESLCLEALAIKEKALGKEHPDYASSLYNLADVYCKTGNYKKAEPLYLEVNSIHRMLIQKAAAYSSENQMLQYLSTFKESQANFQSFTQLHPSTACLRENFNNALFFNGMVLENERLLARAIAGADSATLHIYEKWQDARRRLAKRYAKPIAERKKITETSAEAESYEKALILSLPTFRETRKNPQWQDVRDHLKPAEAAIEFVHYRLYTGHTTDSIQYAALLLRPGWDAPKMIPLFEEKQLDSLILSTGGRKADYVAKVYAVADRGIIAVDKPSKSLYELIWQPLENALAGANTLYFTPTGLLHCLNLAAVPITADSVLADRYHLIELGSTRQLVSAVARTYHNQDAAIFGGIQYEMDSTAIFAANARLIHSDIASRGMEGVDYLDSTSRGGTWNYLKGTEKEVNAIAPILTAAGFATDTRKGFDATEESFKNTGSIQGDKKGSPRVIHLATHGFFFPDPQDTLKKRVAIDANETGFKTSDNPLIRSGLLMAGANYAWKTGKPVKKGMENGILTAYEISNMDLTNTELVVLSACETGLGDIAGNEGVFGLQRAFKIAGAKYLIMSLWQVPDFQTQDLMTTFYSYWLPSAAEAMAGKSEKKSIPEAFRAAQKDMREKYMDAYFWAGFVLVE